MADAHVEMVTLKGAAIARITGEVDLSSARQLADDIAGRTPVEADPLIVDIGDISYMDSAGIQALFELAGARRDAGLGFALVVPDPSPLRRLLKITSFEQAAPVYPSREEALEGLR